MKRFWLKKRITSLVCNCSCSQYPLFHTFSDHTCFIYKTQSIIYIELYKKTDLNISNLITAFLFIKAAQGLMWDVIQNCLFWRLSSMPSLFMVWPFLVLALLAAHLPQVDVNKKWQWFKLKKMNNRIGLHLCMQSVALVSYISGNICFI